MWPWKQKNSKNLMKEVGRYILEEQIEDLNIHINKSIKELQIKCFKNYGSDSSFKTEKSEKIFRELETIKIQFLETIQEIQGFKKKKITYEDICEKINNLRLIKEKYLEDIKKHVNDIEKEHKSYIEYFHEELLKKEREVKKNRRMMIIFSIIAIIGFLFVSSIITIGLTGGFIMKSKIISDKIIFSLIILDLFVVTIFTFFGGLAIYLQEKIEKIFKNKLLQTMTANIIDAIILGPIVLTMLNNRMFFTSIVIPSLLKFVGNIQNLDPITLFISLLAALATLDALISLLEKIWKFIIKRSIKGQELIEKEDTSLIENPTIKK